MAELTYWLIEAHIGTLFGLVNQLILAVIAIGTIAPLFGTTLIVALAVDTIIHYKKTPTKIQRTA